ncbi:ABC transporter substrate-binding protein [Streptomyces sp. WM6373]|uniref:metal ABC transporter substrate-binding protein n=1 Tax=Streptomyces TaxID=1883 RepID=UPI0004C6BB38|nr:MULTISPECIES: metal ABC transporter substrate-binding protein [unclassified Streptomyces]KJY23208.1 ABC transporter substrate-binding protein [Streptomyces sp. NRRL S-104]KOU28396.1 ABC transporter substrate-binding protein [Streptomyces sp. WM6373]KOU68536.1 ABC transporter substrate-binding protein [Streptomyces sp. IGB124]KOU69536.1 ABC transporter substrate-binding protein [Streptomyces sp. XY66]KOV18686.1 ABC transporter substrate-binding protein [Streptomyces sp. XY413]
MNVRRLIPTAALAGAVALGAAALTSCSGAGAVGGEDGKLGVTASFYPLQFVAEQIGKEHVKVDGLTKPGVEPHDLEITPKQTAQLGEADVVLYLKNLQPAVDKAVAQSGVKNIVDAATLTELEAHGASGHDHGAEEAHAEGEGHDHSHGEGGTDPHVWLDPVKYAEIAKGVGAALEKADPGHAADYKKNTDELVGKLAALDTEFKDGLRNTASRTFITTHSAFGYLAERYGLDQEGISGVDPESEPSPARMKDLQAVAKKDNVTTVFFETLASDKTAKTLATDTGLKTDVLDPLEGITDTSQGADYFEVMRSNLKNLQKALGAK